MILTYENVDICHDKRPILSHCNLQIAEGEMVYIEGAVGSGKTTLLHTIYGELKPFAGKAVVLETDLMKLRTSKLPELRRKIGMDFQDFYFLTDKTVGENLDFVLKATGWNDRTSADAASSKCWSRWACRRRSTSIHMSSPAVRSSA